MESKRYYEYYEDHVKGESTDLSLGFSKGVEYIDKRDGHETTSISDAIDNSDNGVSNTFEEFKWITPMEFYQSQHNVNPDKDVTNGMPGVKDIYAQFADQYWWCEDLHNWCVYSTDCVSDPYSNRFYLHVWNGRNGWEQLCIHELTEGTEKYEKKLGTIISVDDSDTISSKPFESWRYKQNCIISKIYQNNNTIIQHRGRTNEIFDFGVGPLNVVNALILQKNDKFTVNSNNKFQTIRWSSQKHIEHENEFIDADCVMRNVTFKVNKKKILIKFRQNFVDKNRDQIGKMAGYFTEHPFIKNIAFNPIDSWGIHREEETTFKDYRIDNTGELVYEAYDHASAYQQWDNVNYYYDNEYDNRLWKNKKRGTNYDETAGIKYRQDHSSDIDVMPYTPLAMDQHFGGHYWSFSELAQEKIFAVYIFNDDDSLPGEEINEDMGWKNFRIRLGQSYQSIKHVDSDMYDKECGGEDDNKKKYYPWADNADECLPFDNDKKNIVPIFMSYIDIEFIFHNLQSVISNFSYPSCKSWVNTTESYSFERWFNTNKLLIQKTIYMLFPEKISDFNKNKKCLDTIVELFIGGQTTVNKPLDVFFYGEDRPPQYDEEDTDQDAENDSKTENTTQTIDPEDEHTYLNEFAGFFTLWSVADSYNYIQSAPKSFKVDYCRSKMVPRCKMSLFYNLNTEQIINKLIPFGIDEYCYSYRDEFTLSKYKSDFENLWNLDIEITKDESTFSKYFKKINKYYQIKDLPKTKRLHKFSTSNFCFLMPGSSNHREGVSIGNPAIWRLPTGEIALCTTLMWGGKNRLIGGPGTDEESVIAANDWVNSIAREYFGKGSDKTINKHWLKDDWDMSEQFESGNSSYISNVTKSKLEYGKVFEQINRIDNNKMSLSVSTYRPNIYTEGVSGNIDLAKKW